MIVNVQPFGGGIGIPFIDTILGVVADVAGGLSGKTQAAEQQRLELVAEAQRAERTTKIVTYAAVGGGAVLVLVMLAGLSKRS